MQIYATSGCTNFDLNFNPDWLCINIFLNPNQKVRKMFYYGIKTTIYSHCLRVTMRGSCHSKTSLLKTPGLNVFIEF